MEIKIKENKTLDEFIKIEDIPTNTIFVSGDYTYMKLDSRHLNGDYFNICALILSAGPFNPGKLGIIDVFSKGTNIKKSNIIGTASFVP